MLPVILGIAAIAALASCDSQDKERVPAPNPPPPPKPHASGDQSQPRTKLSYDKICIMDGNCTSEKFLKALKDYTGAIYGDNSTSPEILFGPLDTSSSPEQIKEWYLNAQKTSLQTYLTGPKTYCDDKDWPLLVANDSALGEVYVMGSYHHCFERAQRELYEAGWERLIAQDPENWLFLIESSRAVEYAISQGESRQDEAALFHHIAEKLGIPIENPLVPVDDEAVISHMEVRGYNRLELAAYDFIGQESTNIISKPIVELTQTEVVDLYHFFESIFSGEITVYDDNIKRVEEIYGLKENTFKAYCQEMWRTHGNTDIVTFYAILKGKASNALRQKVRISNDLSKRRIKDLITQHSQETQFNTPKVFIQIGDLHSPIIPRIYDDVQRVNSTGTNNRG